MILVGRLGCFGTAKISVEIANNYGRTSSLAWDDPVVLVLIVAAVVFLFGSSKIPAFAKSLGQAKREFQKGFTEHPLEKVLETPQNTTPQPAKSLGDSLVEAAENEGIETRGKTRQQIANELASKLSNR